MADALGGGASKVTGAAEPVTSAANPMGQIGGVVGGALTGGIGKLVTAVKGSVDKWFPPEKRSEWTARTKKFANERPTLARNQLTPQAFLLSHIAISGVPLALFVIMTITVAVFAIVAALLVALLAAVAFIVFAVGFALLFLLPTLFFTTLVATFVFLWGLGAYYIVKWFNEKKVPGIHTDLVKGLKGELSDMTEPDELDKLPDLKKASEAPSHTQPQHSEQEEDSSEDEKHPDKPRKRQPQPQQKPNQNGSAKPKKLSQQGSGGALDSVGKTTGVDAGGLGKNVGGVKQAVSG